MNNIYKFVLFKIKPNVKIFEKKIYKPDEVERIGMLNN